MWDNFVFSINFASYKREPKVPHNSEVLKLLREREQEDKNAKSGVKGNSQENQNYNRKDLNFFTSSLPSSLIETKPLNFEMTNRTEVIS